MQFHIDRRGFLKATAVVGAGMGLAGRGNPCQAATAPTDGAPNAERLGWRLGCRTTSFRPFTFYEAIDKVASLGLRYIEAFPGQSLSKEDPNVKMSDQLSTGAREALKKKLSDSGVRLINYGICTFSRDADQNRKTFDFAQEMGIETIVSEPAQDVFHLLDDLSEEYGINVAMHNFPKWLHTESALHWNPSSLIEALEGCGGRMGACADVGHWPRSGLNPLECLKKLEGRIISLHFKDVKAYGPNAYDVPLGTGVCDPRALLAEARRQELKAVFSIEYEHLPPDHNWDDSVPDIARSIEFFEKTAADLIANSHLHDDPQSKL